MGNAVREIEYPAHFRGIFDQIRDRHAPLLSSALDTLRALPVPDELKPAMTYQVWTNPQPSFILLPLMFLATAEACGGITAKHVEYLSVVMLVAELLAVADDTVDRCVQRSGRETYAHRFGDGSALAFSAVLVAHVLDLSRRCDERVYAAALFYFKRFFPHEVWETANTFPEPAAFDTWLDHRYAQSIWSTQYILDAALLLSDRPGWPDPAVAALGRIGQDMDDVVNVVEYRERDGENDDLLCGIVTRPLVAALRARPELGAKVSALWDRHRPLARERLSIAEYQKRRAPLLRETQADYQHVRAVILEHGVPTTVRHSRAELEIAIAETPEPLRPVMDGFARAFLDRLDSCKLVEVR
jgi:geranylgeranyl pyrophosphate synthase